MDPRMDWFEDLFLNFSGRCGCSDLSTRFLLVLFKKAFPLLSLPALTVNDGKLE